VTRVAAWVGERAVPVSAVEERLSAMRQGRYASRLPHESTAEGRNLVRWLVQVVTTEAVVEHEAARRGLTPAGFTPRPVTRPAALRAGGVTATVLAHHPLAAPLRAAVTAGVTFDADAYFARNPDVPRESAPALVEAARDRAFTQWLDERCARLVKLEPGYEHPGDPSHPDYTHHH
jgi:[acyl-carrier-protein] S-malonyltransferase